MKLRDYRLKKALTQAELARRVGVSEAAICRYENGRIPASKVLMRIREVTEQSVTEADFFRREWQAA